MCMNVDHLLEQLNPQQREVVTAPPNTHLRIIAGAGSGKTRVLVHRIAWLMEAAQVSPFSIMAVTFTNKAAYEMRGRIEALCSMSLHRFWIGTFHGLAHRLLRAHWREAELPDTFQILDADDQHRLIRRIHRNLELDEDKWSPKQSQWFINKNKEEGKRSHHIQENGDFFIETMLRVYRTYEEICKRSGLVDFSELLLRSLELLQNNSQILLHYQNRFQHILVDEFQDTNSIQYMWLQTFVGTKSHLMIVGDDDQSIYSWRGAKIENIHRFSEDFPNAKTIRLEQNYRSTQTILHAANAVIANNDSRLGKKLWTAGEMGKPITIYSAFNERDEAHYIVSTIKEWMRQNEHCYRDIAILYRSNAQSRILEEQLIESKIAYRIYGGLKFFDRAEIKDALAYLRLIVNRNDDAAFERVVNMPTRGIGNTTLTTLREIARDNSISLWQSAEFLIAASLLSSRALAALRRFLTLINKLETETKKCALGEQCEHVLHHSGLLTHYKKDQTEQGLSRLENLEELVNATSQFKPDDNDIHLSPLANFLAHVVLETGENQAESHVDYVSLMTLHAAKGLEFPIVIIAGMEEELFPHRMSVEEPQGLEEERRLCYVGMTRAKQHLYLIYTESRYIHGREKFNIPSRFIREIPEKHIYYVRPSTKISRPKYCTDTFAQAANDTGLQIGQRVRHAKFGSGIILNYEGRGAHTRIQVKFDRAGTKWLVASFAKLEVVY